ncbi:MAG: serine/threonine protein kinase [Chloroflexi bacterium]|nr:serine/threonine protein kinase [Chloroflexota bacterium]
MNTQPQRLGKYELQERLGQGGMAEVWKAFDPQLRRYVAIKFLHPDLRAAPDFMARFIREGQAIASLRHPNIVQVYDFLTSSSEAEEPMAYMVMDYVEGQTLAQYARRTSQAGQIPSPNEIVRLLTAISLAIDYAHEHGMIHRDIKPANILLDSRNTKHNSMGEPILTDFGIAKVVGTATLTEVGTSLGTPLYISPEQVRGQPGTEKSDIYSFGVLAYEICAGSPPFRGDSGYMIMLKHAQETPPSPRQFNSALPVAVDEVFARVLAKEPEARFPSAAAMTAALAKAFGVPIPEQIRHAISPFDPGQETLLSTQAASSSNIETVLASDVSRGAASAQRETFVETALASDARNAMPTQVADQTNAPVDRRSGRDPVRDTLPPVRVSAQAPVGASTEPAVVPVPQLVPVHKRNRLLTIVVPLVLLVLIGSGLGTYLLSHSSNTTRGTGGAVVTSSPNVVGQAAFVSSGQLTAQGRPAINDGLQIHLEHVANPSPGNRYYAWLQNSETETTSLLLGSLTVDQGVATLSYSDPQHTDLLAMGSNFLVTEQSSSVVPNSPSLDKTQWRYVGALPQAHSPKDNFGYLDHVRHLLSNDPDLDRLQLPGGVDFWFLNSTQQVQKSAIEVRDHVNIPVVRQQLANIVYALDGRCAPGELSHAPITSPENAVIAHATTIGLLDCAQAPTPPGHLTHISRHLIGISQAPGAPAAQIKRAIDINNELDMENVWLKQVRTDALQLAGMDDTHLAQASSLRNDLAVQANNVVNGAVDPSTQATIPSAQQIASTIEILANFDVMPYKAA